MLNPDLAARRERRKKQHALPDTVDFEGYGAYAGSRAPNAKFK
jgi:hypothetical protein